MIHSGLVLAVGLLFPAQNCELEMLTHQQKEAVMEMVKQQITGADMASFVVATDSMRPIIKPGDTVVVKDWPVEKLIRGDIILYEEQHILYAHRLLDKRLRGKQIILLTKGDSNRTIDPPFLPECFLGKVIAIEKTSQRAVVWLPIAKATGQRIDPSISLRVNPERSRRIDLGARLWKVLSWILAIYSLTEALLFRIARSGKRIFKMKLISIFSYFHISILRGN